jgi:hypothetical protein
VRQAVGDRSHAGHQFLDAREHGVHGPGQLVEDVLGAGDRGAGREVAGGDTLSGQGHALGATDQQSAQPEGRHGDDRQARHQRRADRGQDRSVEGAAVSQILVNDQQSAHRHRLDQDLVVGVGHGADGIARPRQVAGGQQGGPPDPLAVIVEHRVLEGPVLIAIAVVQGSGHRGQAFVMGEGDEIVAGRLGDQALALFDQPVRGQVDASQAQGQGQGDRAGDHQGQDRGPRASHGSTDSR